MLDDNSFSDNFNILNYIGKHIYLISNLYKRIYIYIYIYIYI